MSAQARGWVLQISAGTGPPEARRFVVLLAELLARRCADLGVELLDELPAEPEARSLSLRARGDRSALAGLLGVHALICDSRRGRSGRRRGHRKRWFVEVRARAATPSGEPPRVDPREVEFSFCRAGGPGGQHVNRTATAVHAVHRPTGEAVRVSDSRSQACNRELALVRLAERLHARAQELEQRERHLQHKQTLALERGNPVASWRLDTRAGLRPA
jgi:protein subunit release factor B